MAIRTRNLSQLNDASFEYLIRNTAGRVSQLSPGGIARALVETANRHLEAFYESLSTNMAMAFVSQATGAYLDLHGALFGLSRRTERDARILAEDNALRFYVNSGTLIDRLPKTGDLNRGYIPKGTTITNDDASIVYVVEEDVTFERTATEVFVPARASVAGSSANVGAFNLRKHSLPVYDVFVTNPIAITSGRSIESDEEYRTRIVNSLLAAEGANETAIRLAALSAPGVADVRVIPFGFGAGSFKVMVIPQGNRVPVQTLIDVQRYIENISSFGIFFTVEEPMYRRISMIVSLRYTPDVITTERSVVRNSVERALLNYIGSIPIGGELVMTQVGAIIRQADSRVYDYSIDALCVDGKHQLLHNIALASDELFLPDTGLSDPIKVL